MCHWSIHQLFEDWINIGNQVVLVTVNCFKKEKNIMYIVLWSEDKAKERCLDVVIIDFGTQEHV